MGQGCLLSGKGCSMFPCCPHSLTHSLTLSRSIHLRSRIIRRNICHVNNVFKGGGISRSRHWLTFLPALAILFRVECRQNSFYQKLCLQNKFYDMLTLAVVLLQGTNLFADSSRVGTPHKPRTKLQRLLRHQQQPASSSQTQKPNYYSPFSRAAKISYKISEKNNNNNPPQGGGSLWNFRWESNKSKSLPDLREGKKTSNIWDVFRFPSVSDLIKKCESRSTSPVRITHYQSKKTFADNPRKPLSLSTSKR